MEGTKQRQMLRVQNTKKGSAALRRHRRHSLRTREPCLPTLILKKPMKTAKLVAKAGEDLFDVNTLERTSCDPVQVYLYRCLICFVEKGSHCVDLDALELCIGQVDLKFIEIPCFCLQSAGVKGIAIPGQLNVSVHFQAGPVRMWCFPLQTHSCLGFDLT